MSEDNADFRYCHQRINVTSRNLIKLPSKWVIVENFEDVKSQFTRWLETQGRLAVEDELELEEDRSLPDLWAELDLGIGTTPESESLENTKFSDAEQERIVESINQIKNEIEAKNYWMNNKARCFLNVSITLRKPQSALAERIG